MLLPPDLPGALAWMRRAQLQARKIADYIAGMTDRYAIANTGACLPSMKSETLRIRAAP